ncbi:hypothetical protein T484DRAFT_1920745 [Baffinella frigidus]|nr:hypothetical protein T484DRAFT_1920745 [Cryptophyta sp. CCMP2293]
MLLSGLWKDLGVARERMSGDVVAPARASYASSTSSSRGGSAWWAAEFLSDKVTEALEEKERTVRRIEARLAADEEQEQRMRHVDLQRAKEVLARREDKAAAIRMEEAERARRMAETREAQTVAAAEQETRRCAVLHSYSLARSDARSSTAPSRPSSAMHLEGFSGKGRTLVVGPDAMEVAGAKGRESVRRAAALACRTSQAAASSSPRAWVEWNHDMTNTASPLPAHRPASSQGPFGLGTDGPASGLDRTTQSALPPGLGPGGPEDNLRISSASLLAQILNPQLRQMPSVGATMQGWMGDKSADPSVVASGEGAARELQWGAGEHDQRASPGGGGPAGKEGGVRP